MSLGAYPNHVGSAPWERLDRWVAADGSGNDADDTLGCILVGHSIDGPNRIHGGSEVLPRLFALVQDALKDGQAVWLTIHDAPQAAA